MIYVRAPRTACVEMGSLLPCYSASTLSAKLLTNASCSDSSSFMSFKMAMP